MRTWWRKTVESYAFAQETWELNQYRACSLWRQRCEDGWKLRDVHKQVRRLVPCYKHGEWHLYRSNIIINAPLEGFSKHWFAVPLNSRNEIDRRVFSRRNRKRKLE